MKIHLNGEHSDPEREPATQTARKPIGIGKCLFKDMENQQLL